MENKTVKMGVIGLGRGRSVLTDALKEGVKLVAICDRDEEKLQSAKEHFEKLGVENLQCYNDFDKMLAESDMDAVFIATDAVFHVPFVKKAMEAGKHVLSEIPAVNSVEEAKELKTIVTSHPELKYMAGENCCYWEFIQKWKTMYDNGKLGQAVYAESEYLHSGDYRKFKKEDYPEDHWRTYNPAIKYLTHNLGPLLYIMDDKVVSVTCMIPDVVYNPYVPKPRNGVALFKTAKGAVIRILIVFDAYVGFDHNFTILGTRGTLETDKNVMCVDAHTYAKFDDIPLDMNTRIELPMTLGDSSSGHGGADGKMVKAFVDCIINDTKPPIDVDMGIAISLPGIIASESAIRGGELLEIPEI